jgi:hypothetical protein
MDSVRADLARQVLMLLAQGQPVPIGDAFRLRNWAVRPENALLPLEEIAHDILVHAQKQHANAAKQQ